MPFTPHLAGSTATSDSESALHPAQCHLGQGGEHSHFILPVSVELHSRVTQSTYDTAAGWATGSSHIQILGSWPRQRSNVHCPRSSPQGCWVCTASEQGVGRNRVWEAGACGKHLEASGGIWEASGGNSLEAASRAQRAGPLGPAQIAPPFGRQYFALWGAPVFRTWGPASFCSLVARRYFALWAPPLFCTFGPAPVRHYFHPALFRTALCLSHTKYVMPSHATTSHQHRMRRHACMHACMHMHAYASMHACMITSHHHNLLCWTQLAQWQTVAHHS